MDIIWIKVDSWHAVSSVMQQATVCGLDVSKGDHEVRNTLPAEKSCENCLRIVARKADSVE